MHSFMVSPLPSNALPFIYRDRFCSSNDSGDAGIVDNAYHLRHLFVGP